MCATSNARARDAKPSAPRPAPGADAGPIRLRPVDDARVTILTDDTSDALLVADDRTARTGSGPVREPVGQFIEERAAVGLTAARPACCSTRDSH